MAFETVAELSERDGYEIRGEARNPIAHAVIPTVAESSPQPNVKNGESPLDVKRRSWMTSLFPYQGVIYERPGVATGVCIVTSSR
jgi:hypothetical protein